ncbi:ABC transporter, ATP-binding protein, related to Nod factor export [Desulfococcus multivorans]|nr:ABC transporter, ATP-binding protein, related to Nod factor export [Desulfococcus multivorans]
MKAVLEVRGLVKAYGDTRAVDGISFAIPPGICFGLLGPNGAGKTTTIEVIEDILPLTAGEILYRGRPRTPAFKREIGVQFQHTTLLDFLTVREMLATFQAFYDIRSGIDELSALCRLEDILEQYADRISGGQKQRMLLALALVNDPKLVFLDEPSTGLDPQARRNLWDIVLDIKARGKTVVLTTHYMEEAQHLCDEVAIMDHGRIIAQGAPDALIRRHCRGTTVVLPRGVLPSSPDRLGLQWRAAGENVIVETEEINACLKTLMDRSVDLNDVIIHSPNLEDVFLKLTGRKLRD